MWQPAILNDPKQLEINRAISKLGTNNLSILFVDFSGCDDVPMYSNHASGTHTHNSDGTMSLSTSATAGRQAQRAIGASGDARNWPGGSSNNFYMSGRLKCNVVPTLGGIISVIGSGAEGSYLGANANQSATKYSFTAAGSANAILSTVSVQTANYDTLRCWRVSTTTSLSVNDETPVTANAYMTAPSVMGPLVFNGTATVDMIARVDWFMLAFPRAT